MNKPTTKIYVIAEEVDGERIYPEDSIWPSAYKTLNAAKYAIEEAAINMFYENWDDETPFPPFIKWYKNKYSSIWFGRYEIMEYTIIEIKLQ